MRRCRRSLPIAATVLVLLGVGAALVLHRGFSARDQPLAFEAFVARHLRRLAIPRAVSSAANPLPATSEVLAAGRAHFADHCATCHANDGSGQTEIGRHLYPPAPDMRRAETQELLDGELFYIIHNGIRFTGMPAWGPADPAQDQDTWALVHFIRRLPTLSRQDIEAMRTLNPVSRKDLEDEDAVERFLRGAGDAPAANHH